MADTEDEASGKTAVRTPEKSADRRGRFREKARSAPESPGVYIMRDEAGTIIYVGKAKILRNRLLSYFTGKKDLKTSHLVARVESIDWTLADSEYDALLLENNLIKEHSPKYNISLKDGRTYPSVRITAEEFPRVFRTRRIINDGSEYYGPFPSAETIDLLLDLVDRLFPLRRCQKMRKREQPCMYYHIGRCPGPCAGKIGKDAYMERVDEVRKLLSGQTSDLIADLASRMQEASASLRFEEAARLRDSIQALELFAGKTKIQDFDPAARDYVGWESDGDLCAFVVFSMRNGKMVGRDSFVSPNYSDEEEAAQTFLISYYGKGRLPPPFLFLKKVKGTKAVSRYFRAELGMRVSIEAPREDRHAAVMNLAVQNAREELIKRRREGGDLSALAELRDRLGLDRLPRRIEGFDIAHLAGKHTVASLISFVDGVPDKKNYRYFKIRSLEGRIDDFASMREAVARRYSRLVNEEAELPDLVLVDGGAGQVSAAKEILDELGLDCGLAGLAKKNEEVYLPGREEPLILPRDSAALRVLVALRDETHRFATGLSGRLRSKELKAAVLEAVEGIGEKRSRKLLKSFGSLAAIACAEPERIATAAGISRELALEVKARASAAS
ncbi:MAG TPA: excinuclease ABC subunit UvrC [Rectinemataceae bacterium]